MRLELPAPFVTGTPLSAADLNLLIDAAVMLDGLSFRTQPACESSDIGRRNTTEDTTAQSNYRMWWGTLQFRTGMEYVQAYGFSDNAAGTILLYVDGVLRDTANAHGGPNATAWSLTYDMRSAGYADGRILPIEIRANGNTTKTGRRWTLGVWAEPVAASAWPGVPNFNSHQFTAVHLNQLRSASQWIWDRINAVPIIPQQGQVLRPNTHKSEKLTLFRGGLMRSFSQEELRVEMFGRLHPNATEVVTVEVNGVVVYTGPTIAQNAGGYTYDIKWPLTHTIGDFAAVEVFAEATVPTPYTRINSRYDIRRIGTAAVTTTYPVQAPPTSFIEDGSINADVLRTRLNDIADMLLTSHQRIQNNPHLWNRYPIPRRRYAMDNNQNTKLAKRYVGISQRKGDRLVVRGKGVVLLWGWWKVAEKEGELDYDDYEFQYSQGLTDGQAVETKTIYFDAYPSLFVGVWYALGGDLHGAWEYME